MNNNNCESNTQHFQSNLQNSDNSVFQIIKAEHERQKNQIELIASENLVSRAVLEAQGSVFTNKTVEGFPENRYFGGAEFADQIENLAIQRACELFGAKYALVQPHSGSQANQIACQAVLSLGDKILSMDLNAGGHLSHGSKANISGKIYNVSSYSVNPKTYLIDYDEVEQMALQFQPKLIIAGGSSYPREINFEKFKQIAQKVGALLLVDMAHFAGLVATGFYNHPFPYADIVTTTTYKSLRGARGGIILVNDESLFKKMKSNVFPGIQGSAMLHQIAGKAVCLGEALKPEFKQYNGQLLKNAQAMIEIFKKNGVTIISNGTDTSMILLDLRNLNLTGQYASEKLEKAGLNVNKNNIPFDTQKPSLSSGIRVSVNAGTTRGFKETEFTHVAELISEMLLFASGSPTDADLEKKQKSILDCVSTICSKFPFYGDL